MVVSRPRALMSPQGHLGRQGCEPGGLFPQLLVHAQITPPTDPGRPPDPLLGPSPGPSHSPTPLVPSNCALHSKCCPFNYNMNTLQKKNFFNAAERYKINSKLLFPPTTISISLSPCCLGKPDPPTCYSIEWPLGWNWRSSAHLPAPHVSAALPLPVSCQLGDYLCLF